MCAPTDEKLYVLPEVTKTQLQELAAKYEVEDFIEYDPVKYPRQFKDKCNQEIVGFIAAWLAYGRREQFMPVIEHIIQQIAATGKTPYEFVMTEAHKKVWFDVADTCLYRFNTYHDLIQLCDALYHIYTDYSTLEDSVLDIAMKDMAETNVRNKPLVEHLIRLFKPYRVEGIPLEAKSACKRLNMFLRWMVRKNSPVDLGIWTRFLPTELLVPLDTHVARMGRQLGLISRRSNDMQTVKELTYRCMEAFPTDPVKADFALFGYGVNNHSIGLQTKIKEL